MAIRPIRLLLPALALSSAVALGAARPNILFLFADDQRADTIAALGNPEIRTPNLDRIARTGLSFSRPYMQGSLQPATRVPSRSMLLSGQSLFHVDLNLRSDPFEIHNLATNAAQTARVSELTELMNRKLAEAGDGPDRDDVLPKGGKPKKNTPREKTSGQPGIAYTPTQPTPS